MYRGRRNVTRVQGSVTGIQDQSVTGTGKNEWGQKYKGGHVFMVMVYSWAYECCYKLNDQPVRERVMASDH